MRKTESKKTYLLVRLSSLSDVVIASPFAKLLKEQNPNCRVIWITQPENAPFLNNNPYIDRVISWDKTQWLFMIKNGNFLKFFQEARKLSKDLRRESIDTAFDLQGLFKSGFITWLSKAKKRIGVGSREGSYWFMDKMVSTGMINRHHLGADYSYLATQLGFDDRAWRIDTHISQPNKDLAKKILHTRLSPNEDYAVICPFTTKPSKAWPQEHWQQLILRIRGRHQLKTIIIGHENTQNHIAQANELERATGAINLNGLTDIHEATAIIQNASLVVGVDNGLTHLSQCMGMPSVALFGPSIPYLHANEITSKAIHLNKSCSPCNKKPICGGNFDCMKEITPDQVLAELRRLFKHAEKKKAA